LSPIKVGNHVLKNRIIAGMGEPYNARGPEEYPNDAVITHYANKAKSGASIVCIDEYLQRPYGRHI